MESFLYYFQAILNKSNLYQFLAICCCVLLAFLITFYSKDQRKKLSSELKMVTLNIILKSTSLFFFILFFFHSCFYLLFQALSFESTLLNISQKVVLMGTIIFFGKGWIKSKGNRKAWLVTSISASILYISGIFPFVAKELDHYSLNLGKFHLTLYTLLKSILFLIFSIWVAHQLAKKLEKKIKANKTLQPSSQILFSKISKIFLIGLSAFLGLSLVGIDLSIFAFFAGALGLGAGFGLQNAFSNLFCGISLLLDRSIKPGDVIALHDGKVYGVVNQLNARYVSVRTREGKEHLIPNEQFITNKVENWSYSDNLIRIPVKFRVGFESDLELVEKILHDATKIANRIKKAPTPTVRFKNIIENSVEVEVRFWIDDPENGMSNLKSEVILEVWKRFRQNGIRIPYTPREVYLSHSHQEPLETLRKLSTH